MPKKQPASPFVGFSIEEVFASEAISYVIQVGSDFYSEKGQLVFTKQRAKVLYNRILEQVVRTMHTGDAKQKKNAHRVLRNLKILPLRIN